MEVAAGTAVRTALMDDAVHLSSLPQPLSNLVPSALRVDTEAFLQTGHAAVRYAAPACGVSQEHRVHAERPLIHVPLRLP